MGRLRHQGRSLDIGHGVVSANRTVPIIWVYYLSLHHPSKPVSIGIKQASKQAKDVLN